MAADIEASRKRILDATIIMFREQGLKFTMDDLAKSMNMSKKTIYTAYRDKEQLFLAIVDYGFERIRSTEDLVLQDMGLSYEEKLRKVLGVLPEIYKDIDFDHLYYLKEKYPRIYDEVEQRITAGWERTTGLIEQGIEAGVFRPINIPIFKAMLEATLAQFIQRDILCKNHISYQMAVDDVVEILVNGIAVRVGENVIL